jgi:hypothetical protein
MSKKTPQIKASAAAPAPAPAAAQSPKTDSAAPTAEQRQTDGADDAAEGQVPSSDTTGTVGSDTAGQAAAAEQAAAGVDSADSPPPAPQAARPTPGKRWYVVVSPLNDGTLHAIDSEIELTEAQAAPLLGHTVRPKS